MPPFVGSEPSLTEFPVDLVIVLYLAALALLTWGLVRLCEKV
jgi:hypothetical protein